MSRGLWEEKLGALHLGDVLRLGTSGTSSDWCFSGRLDGKHVVFGRVKEGMNVVEAMERCGSKDGKTSKKITIADCGQLS